MSKLWMNRSSVNEKIPGNWHSKSRNYQIFFSQVSNRFILSSNWQAKLPHILLMLGLQTFHWSKVPANIFWKIIYGNCLLGQERYTPGEFYRTTNYNKLCVLLWHCKDAGKSHSEQTFFFTLFITKQNFHFEQLEYILL